MKKVSIYLEKIKYEANTLQASVMSKTRLLLPPQSLPSHSLSCLWRSYQYISFLPQVCAIVAPPEGLPLTTSLRIAVLLIAVVLVLLQLCFWRIRWKFLDISISIPTPPTWPKNSTAVTSAPSLCQTEPCRQ